MIFKLTPRNGDFLNTAPWIFRSEIVVDVSASAMWNILFDDEAWAFWHTEVAKCEWKDANRELNSECTFTIKDTLFMMLLCGPMKLYTVNDVYEKDMKWGFYVKESNIPSFLGNKAVREEFKLEAVSEKQCKFTRIVAMAPSFLSKYLMGWLVYPHLKHAFTKRAPECLVKAIAEGKLPRQPQK